MPIIKCRILQKVPRFPVMTNSGVVYDFVALADFFLAQQNSHDPDGEIIHLINYVPEVYEKIKLEVGFVALSEDEVSAIFDRYSRLQHDFPKLKLDNFEQFFGFAIAIKYASLTMIHNLLSNKQVSVVQTIPEYKTPLICAVSYRQLSIAEALLTDHRVNPNIFADDGMTALILAVRSGQLSMVHTLLTHRDVDPNQADSILLNTPLIYAVLNHSFELVMRLVSDRRVKLDQVNRAGENALMIATRLGYLDIVKILNQMLVVNELDLSDLVCALIGNPHPDIRSDSTPLMILVILKRFDIVRALLRDQRILPYQQTDNHLTPLMQAVRDGQLDLVCAILVGDMVNPRLFGQVDLTPRTLARFLGKPDHIDSPINPNQALADGTTPLLLAVKCGWLHIVGFLLSNKRVNPNQALSNETTPLLLAVMEQQDDIASLLLADKRVNPNISNAQGISPLNFALDSENIRLLEALLSIERIEPNYLYGESGNPPLIRAVLKNRIDIVRCLLKNKKINPNQHNRENKTALHVAAEMGNDAIVRELLQLKNINPNKALPDSGLTPLLVAAFKRNFSLVELFLENEKVRQEFNQLIYQVTLSTDLKVISYFLNYVSTHEMISDLMVMGSCEAWNHFEDDYNEVFQGYHQQFLRGLLAKVDEVKYYYLEQIINRPKWMGDVFKSVPFFCQELAIYSFDLLMDLKNNPEKYSLDTDRLCILFEKICAYFGGAEEINDLPLDERIDMNFGYHLLFVLFKTCQDNQEHSLIFFNKAGQSILDQVTADSKEALFQRRFLPSF